VPTVLALAAAVTGAALGGSAVRSVLSRSSPPIEVSAEAADSPSPAPPGFHTVTKTAEGFSVNLPDALQETPLTAADLARNADAVAKTNPGMAAQMRSNPKVASQIRLFAMDPSTGGVQMVQKIEGQEGADINDAPKGMFAKEYRDLGGTADEGRVHLPAGDAVLVSASVPLGGSTVPVIQYVLAHGDAIWILANSTGHEGDTASAASIASSFRFL
jgi:hypothetical protein